MVDKVMELAKKILERFKEWWNKFQPKQKTIIICAAAGVLVAVCILVGVLTRKQYVELAVCESTKEAASVKDLLDGEALDYKVSDDGLNFQILSTQESDANILLGANNIPTASYTLDDVLDGSFSTTEADKQKRYRLYLESQMEDDLESYASVQSATVQLTIPEDNGTLIAQNQETFASVLLTLDSEVAFTEENAAAMARFVATGLGNETTDNVTITDINGTIWFPVEDEYASVDKADTMMLVKQEAESLIKSEVRQVLLGTNEFTQIEVATNLTMDFSKKEVVEHTYTPADGQDQGVLSHEEVYQSNATDGVGGVPGTDSNSETDYLINEANSTNSSSYERKSDYLPNEKITTTTEPTGTIVYADSSVSAAMVRYKILKEEDAQLQGFLDGITWEEYKLANAGRTKLEVDTDWISLVSNATGIPNKNITLVAYEEMQFVDTPITNVSYKDIIQIVLIIIILGLLAFVVFMSLRTKREVEEEEELSVEDLLQSTQQEELENIELEQKSEARKLIENFVEENPEAVATLLRNWLDEDWG